MQPPHAHLPVTLCTSRWRLGALALVLSGLMSACHTPPPRPRTHVNSPRPSTNPSTNTSTGMPVTSSPATTAKPASARPSDAELLALPDPIVKAEPKARLGNPPSYVALGQRYTVLDSAHGYVERGVASWYGPNFHGEKASVGETYDMYALTGAHRVLPLPCYARITNLKNGRSVIVRLNDRGPFVANRIVDLSYAAALKLDMLREGTALVELRVIEADQSSVPVAKPDPLYAQVGAFADRQNALNLQATLSAAKLGPVLVVSEPSPAGVLFKVRLGPVDSVTHYDTLVGQLHRLGFSSVSLVAGSKGTGASAP
jgi:rare lipoprotein A